MICPCSAVTVGLSPKWPFLSCLLSLQLSEPTINILLLYFFPTRIFNSVPIMFFLVSFLVFFQKRLPINLLGSQSWPTLWLIDQFSFLEFFLRETHVCFPLAANLLWFSQTSCMKNIWMFSSSRDLSKCSSASMSYSYLQVRPLNLRNLKKKKYYPK